MNSRSRYISHIGLWQGGGIGHSDKSLGYFKSRRGADDKSVYLLRKAGWTLNVEITDDTLSIDLEDRHSVSVPSGTFVRW